jgi:hypothetical protein
VRNPPLKFQTELFKLEIFKENTTELLAINDDIHGIKISSGIIDEVKVTKLITQNDFSLTSFDPNKLEFSNSLKGQ